MTLNTYVIEGGVGKQIAFTSIISKLAVAAGQPIQLWTPYVDVFAGNPNVAMAYDMNTIPIDDPRILQSDNIIYVEPYKSNFAKGDQHLIESYCELLGVDYSPRVKPELFTDSAKTAADEWRSKEGINGDYILVQFSGGQSTVNYDPASPYQSSNPQRNYPLYFAQYIVNKIAEKYPNLTIIDCTLPNEPALANTIKCDQYWTLIAELAKKAKGFIGIDSMVQHICAATSTPGVVVWGNTRWTQFGWMHHKNMSFHLAEPNHYFKTDLADPRNLLVDPDLMLQVFDEYIMQGQKTSDDITVSCSHA